MDMDSFIVYIKSENIYVNIEKVVKTRFDTSNYELESTLPTGEKQKVFLLMKDELDGKIVTEFVALWQKPYSYLLDYNEKKDTKKCVIKRKVKFED